MMLTQYSHGIIPSMDSRNSSRLVFLLRLEYSISLKVCCFITTHHPLYLWYLYYTVYWDGRVENSWLNQRFPKFPTDRPSQVTGSTVVQLAVSTLRRYSECIRQAPLVPPSHGTDAEGSCRTRTWWTAYHSRRCSCPCIRLYSSHYRTDSEHAPIRNVCCQVRNRVGGSD